MIKKIRLDAAAIPEQLKERPQWVNWKKELRNGKETKVPYQSNGQKARPNDLDTWADFGTCLTAFENGADFDGIGFVFNHDFDGIDCDDCVDLVTGEITDPMVARFVRRCNSYAEYSQSGRGLHIFIKGCIPGSRRRKGNVEIYDSDRFFCVTGKQFPGTPHTINTNQDALDELYAEVFGKEVTNSKDKSKIVNENPDKILDAFLPVLCRFGLYIGLIFR